MLTRSPFRTDAVTHSTRSQLPPGAPDNEERAARAIAQVLSQSDEPMTARQLAAKVCRYGYATAFDVTRALAWMARLGNIHRHHLGHEQLAYSMAKKRPRATMQRAA